MVLLFGGCEEKAMPVVTINPNLKLPIVCMKLDVLDVEKDFINRLKEQYAFDETCPLTLSVSYKKDIVCNSTQNVNMKSLGKFPRSYLKLQLRKGMEMEYTYYIDLFSNIDGDDVEEGFKRLKEDLIS
jgi:hypothetical protein